MWPIRENVCVNFSPTPDGLQEGPSIQPTGLDRRLMRSPEVFTFWHAMMCTRMNDENNVAVTYAIQLGGARLVECDGLLMR